VATNGQDPNYMDNAALSRASAALSALSVNALAAAADAITSMLDEVTLATSSSARWTLAFQSHSVMRSGIVNT
jgi:hypothetical protein